MYRYLTCTHTHRKFIFHSYDSTGAQVYLQKLTLTCGILHPDSKENMFIYVIQPLFWYSDGIQSSHVEQKWPNVSEEVGAMYGKEKI